MVRLTSHTFQHRNGKTKHYLPSIELIPAKWRLKILRSTEGPEWLVVPDNGGYLNKVYITLKRTIPFVLIVNFIIIL